jgi:hypothetical protein
MINTIRFSNEDGELLKLDEHPNIVLERAVNMLIHEHNQVIVALTGLEPNRSYALIDLMQTRSPQPALETSDDPDPAA